MNTSNFTKTGLILNTRPEDYNARFHEAFGDLPWAIYDCPLTRAEPIGSVVPSPDQFDSVIFTSQMGVKMFWSDPRWQQKRVFTVGEATGEAAVAAGYGDVVSTGENVGHMRYFLTQTPFTRAFYPSATEVTAELENEFPGKIVRVPVYQMAARPDLPQQFVAQAKQMCVLAPLFSHRSAIILADLLTKAGLTKQNSLVIAIGISRDVFAGVDGPWHRQVAANKPLMPHMVAVTQVAINQLTA